MLNVLPEPAATIVAAAAFTGARKGEFEAFSGKITTGKKSAFPSPTGGVTCWSQRLERVRRQFRSSRKLRSDWNCTEPWQAILQTV
jgi:hypothetical protein